MYARMRRSLNSIPDSGRILFYLCGISLFLSIVIAFYIVYEGWTFINSMFFVISTLSTVGYGNPAPTNDVSRLFTMIFILVGICFVFAGITDFFYDKMSAVRQTLCKRTVDQVAEDITIGDFYYYRRRLTTSFVLFILLIIIGALVLKYNEGWSWITAFYFVVETSSTVGYGDISLQKKSSVVFICFYISISTFLLTSCIKNFNSSLEESQQISDLETRLRKMESLKYYCSTNIPSCGISKHEFILSTLLYSDVINQTKDIDPWHERFYEFSRSISDRLTEEEYQSLLNKESEVASLRLQNLLEVRNNGWVNSLESFLQGVVLKMIAMVPHPQEHSPSLTVNDNNLANEFISTSYLAPSSSADQPSIIRDYDSNIL